MSQYFGDSLHFKTISNLFIYLERSTSEQLSPKLSLSVLLGTLFFFFAEISRQNITWRGNWGWRCKKIMQGLKSKIFECNYSPLEYYKPRKNNLSFTEATCHHLKAPDNLTCFFSNATKKTSEWIDCIFQNHSLLT